MQFRVDLKIMWYLATILTAILGAVISHLVYTFITLITKRRVVLWLRVKLWSDIWPKNEYICIANSIAIGVAIRWQTDTHIHVFIHKLYIECIECYNQCIAYRCVRGDRRLYGSTFYWLIRSLSWCRR